MSKSKSQRPLRDERDDRRYSSRSHHDDQSGSDLGRTPPSGRRVTGKAGVTEAKRRYDEDDAHPSGRSWTKGGRSPSRASLYRDDTDRPRSSGVRRKFSDPRDQEDRHDSDVSRAADRRSSRHSRTLDDGAHERTLPDQRKAGAYDSGGAAAEKGRAVPSATAKKSQVLRSAASKTAGRDASATRESPPDRYSPPRRSSARDRDESRVDRWSDTRSPGSPPGRSSLPRRTSDKRSWQYDDRDFRSTRRDSDVFQGRPGYRDSPPRKTSRTFRERDDYGSRIEQRSHTWRSDSPPGRASPPRKNVSEAPRLRDGYDSRRGREGGIRRSDSLPGRSSPQRRSASTTSRWRDDYGSRTDHWRRRHSLDSPRDRFSPPRRTSQPPGARDFEVRAEHRSGAWRSDSLRDRGSPPRRSTSRSSRYRDDYEFSAERRSGGHSPGTPRDNSRPPWRASRFSRDRDDIELSTARRSGPRRSYSPPELSIPPRRSSSRTPRWRDYYESRADRWSGARSPDIPHDRTTPPRETISKPPEERGYFEWLRSQFAGSPKSDSPPDKIRDDSERRKDSRKGSLRPGSPPSRKLSTSKAYSLRGDLESPTNARSGDPNKAKASERHGPPSRKASISPGERKKGAAVDTKPATKAEATAKPSESSGKRNVAGRDVPQPKIADSAKDDARSAKKSADGSHVPQQKTADGATTSKDASKPKPLEGLSGGRDKGYPMITDFEEEESEPTPQPKEETPPSEEYVPPSEVGKQAPEVVLSLGPFSDDDDEEGQQEYAEDDSSFGWFRLWVLCSVAAIVLLIPFSLTIMSYEVAAKVQGHREAGSISDGGSGGDVKKPLPKEHTGIKSGGVVFNTTYPANVTYYDDKAGRSKNCEPVDYSSTPALQLKRPTQPSPPSSPYLRKVFCVYDIMTLPGIWTTEIEQFPYEFCSDIIVYSYYASISGDVSSRRTIMIDGVSQLPFDWTNTTRYLTIGGSRADSRGVSEASIKATPAFDETVKSLRLHKYQGVNIDWDHPNDTCDVTQGRGLQTIITKFANERFEVLLTVPPDANVVKKHYAASMKAAVLEISYVIVATHRLRPVGLVCCSGGQHNTAVSYLAVRNLLGVDFYNRMAYSVALGGDVFFSMKQAFWTPAIPLSQFYGKPQGIPRSSYVDVCSKRPVNKTDDCTMYGLGQNSSGYHVAAFANTADWKVRQLTTIGYNFAEVPVVVYDIFLDDYAGVCQRDKWPLLRTVSGSIERRLPPIQ